MLSEIARAVFPASSASSILYFVVQGTTLAILVLAANTSYQGFPRLAAVLASDRFFPRQFVNLGDRLVYSNGIIVLAAVAALLIWVFHADVISLIHLYVIGVFTAFTLSQAGMVRYWRRSSDPGRNRRALVNGIGAAATGLVTLVVIQTKFTQGAWMVTVAVPVLIVLFLLVNRHYRGVARRLRARSGAVRSVASATNRVVVYVETSRRGHRACSLVCAGDRRTRLHRGVRSGQRPAGPARRLVGPRSRPGRDAARRATSRPSHSSTTSGGSRTVSPSS